MCVYSALFLLFGFLLLVLVVVIYLLVSDMSRLVHFPPTEQNFLLVLEMHKIFD